MYTHYMKKPKYTYTLISALASAPSRPPNPTLTPKTKLIPKKTRSKVPKTQKTGCAYSEHYTK